MQTRTHAAAALANIPDIALLESVGCDNLVQSLQEASDVLQACLSRHCHLLLPSTSMMGLPIPEHKHFACPYLALDTAGCVRSNHLLANVEAALRECILCVQDDISKPCNDHEQSLKVDVTNIQSYQALKQQLRRSLCHIQALRSFENTIP